MARNLPQNLEAEQALLGTVIVYPSAMDTCFENDLEPSDFYDIKHQTLFRNILELYNEKKSTDFTSILARLNDKNILSEVGGVDYLSQLTDSVVSGYSVNHYIELIQDKALLRNLIQSSQNIMEDCFENSFDSQEVMDKAEKLILNITHSRRTSNFRVANEVVTNVMHKTEELAKSDKGITGVKTGFRHLDNLTHGFQSGDLIILAARPSVGKTAFSLNLVTNAAILSGKPMVFFSLEMPAESLITRILAMQSAVDISRLRSGKLHSEEWMKLTESAAKVKNLPIYIDDSSSVRISEVFAKCRKLKHEKGIGMIVVDYLQLLSGSKSVESRLQEVAEISRGLKGLARELEVPVIALSQLSRSVEQRTGAKAGKPMLSDLRESGSIEQDADIVMFLSKDPETEENENPNIIVDVAKHRNGAVAEVKLAFQRSSNLFLNIEEHFGN